MRFLFLFLSVYSFVFGDKLALKLQKLIDNKSEKSVEILKYNPFFTKKEMKQMDSKKSNSIKQEKTVKKIDLKLITILDNKAFVGGRWIAKNDIIYGYRVKKILKNSVVLKSRKKEIVLKFRKTKEILKVRKK